MGINAMKKIILNQLGVSAMSMVVGAAIVGGVGLGAATLMKNMASSAKGGDVRQEVQSFMDDISDLLTDKVACRNSFTGVNAADGAVTVINDKDGNPKYSVGETYGIQRLKLVSMRLQDLPGLDDTVEIIPGDEGSTRLVIKFVQQKEGSVEIRKTLNIFVSTSGATAATATVEACYSSASASGSYWLKDQTNPANIFYDEGLVGMGVEDPKFPLDVRGPIAVNQGGDVIEFGGTASQFELRLSDVTKPIEFENVGAGTNADIHARNMTVGSYIKLNSTGTCDSSNNGAIKYNSSSKKIEMCESGAWVAKEYEEWCVPYWKRKEQDDNGMYFWQVDSARREKGTGCDRVQIKDREDNTGHDDLKIQPPDYGYRIRHDHSSDPCVNDQLCQTWRDLDQ